MRTFTRTNLLARTSTVLLSTRVFRTFSGYACAVSIVDVYTCRKKMSALSESEVEKAHQAINFLSSISLPTSTTPTSSTNVENSSSSEAGKKSTPVMEAADKSLDALRRMRAGMTADRRVEKRKRIKNEVSMLLNKKPKVEKKCVVWDQDRIPTTDAEKEELYQAGLWEKEIEFESLDIPQSEIQEKLFKSFPRLRDGGGFQLLKGLPNSRSMEVLSMAVHTSPNLLKQRVGVSRTYV